MPTGSSWSTTHRPISTGLRQERPKGSWWCRSRVITGVTGRSLRQCGGFQPTMTIGGTTEKINGTAIWSVGGDEPIATPGCVTLLQ
jgi:hypothetical protein